MTLVLAAGFTRLTVFAFIALAAPVAAVVKGGFITFANGLRLTLGLLVFTLLLLF